jgi:hypothetical protein
MSLPFTITPGRQSPTGRAHWLDIAFHDGRKVTGNARMASHVNTDTHPGNHDEPPRHVFVLDLSPTLVDSNGNTVYRTADPDADEIQAMHAVIAHPVRVNGGAYRGTLYIERGYDSAAGRHIEPGSHWYPGAWTWRVAYSSIERLDGPKVTDAARSTLHDLAHQLAETLGTPERLHDDRVKDAQYKHTEAVEAERKAQQRASETWQLLSALTNPHKS